MDDSFQIQHKARKYIPGGFSTESKKTDALFGSDFEPAYFKSAEGAELIDWEGKRYIDFGMGIGACNLGYNHPVVAEAIENELKKGIVTTLSSPLEPDLAELIVEMFPSIEQVRFLKTGAEACSAAVRLARAYTYREYILASGYFGWHDWCNKDAGVPIATRNLCIEFLFNDSSDLLDKFNNLPEYPAAVILEPVYNGFKTIARDFPKIADVSGIPQMAMIRPHRNLPNLKYFEAELFAEVLTSGFIIRRNGYNYVSYAHTEQHIRDCLDVLYTAFERVSKQVS
jgi:glutamate-1-semialdehyde aminotransferase